MIRVYPSKLQGEPLETHNLVHEMTIGGWLRATVPSYSARDIHPISIECNGELVDSAAWDSYVIAPDDQVDITPEPRAGITLGAALIYAAVAVAAAALVVALMPKPSMKSQNGPGQGDQLNDSSIKGNKVKPNDPIREIAGRRRIYPDYLLPPHRFFTGPRELWVEMLLCIGKGKYEVTPSRILIGDTPLISLGDDAEFTIYPPGVSLENETAAEWWHSAEEVGATSTGTSGLTLGTTFEVETQPDAISYIFSGDTITIPNGAGEFPDGWAPGMIVRIEAPQLYTVVDGGPGERDIIRGSLQWLMPFGGMMVEIVGDNAGLYSVESLVPGDDADDLTLNYADGSPAIALQLGQMNMGIGYVHLRYRIVAVGASAITVERMTDTGAADPEWAGFPDFNSADAVIVLDSSTVEGDWTGPFMACPPSETATHIEYDVVFPGGLTGVDKKGRKYIVSVTVEAQYRDANIAGGWTVIRKTYSAASLDQRGHTERIQLPYPMRPEVRLRRIGAQSNSTQKIDSVQWYGLRSKLPAPTLYDGVTCIAVRVRGGERLSAQTEQQVSTEVTRVLPVRSGNGVWDVETPTRDIVPFVAHVARSVGYSDSDIDLDALDRLAQVWYGRGDTFDMSYDSSTTVKQVLGHALKAGFSDLTLKRGLISAARDEPRSLPQSMYSPQNMTEPLTREFTAITDDEYDGVDVEYVDARTWAVETVQCRLPGDVGRKVEKLTAEGFTSRTKAWQLGMRQRRAHRYRRWSYNWTTELDALNSGYLEYCTVADDVPGYAQSAILLSVEPHADGLLLESSEPLVWTDANHIVGIRRPDGTMSGPWPATRVDDWRLIIPDIDFEPDTTWDIEPPHLLFGTTTRFGYPVLISSTTPSGTESVSVEAVNYDARIYADDNNAPA